MEKVGCARSLQDDNSRDAVMTRRAYACLRNTQSGRHAAGSLTKAEINIVGCNITARKKKYNMRLFAGRLSCTRPLRVWQADGGAKPSSCPVVHPPDARRLI